MRVIAKSNNVIIRPEVVEKKVGSLFIPETAGEKKHKWGIIESIGDGDFEVKVGDRVLYSTSGVTAIEDVHVVPYSSILLISL